MHSPRQESASRRAHVFDFNGRVDKENDENNYEDNDCGTSSVDFQYSSKGEEVNNEDLDEAGVETERPLVFEQIITATDLEDNDRQSPNILTPIDQPPFQIEDHVLDMMQGGLSAEVILEDSAELRESTQLFYRNEERYQL